MKTIVYSNGDGYDYVTYAVLQVPDEMTVDRFRELWKVFKAENYPDEKNTTYWDRSNEAEWQANYNYVQRQNELLVAKGYERGDDHSLFVSWLCENHGCRKIAYEEWD